MFFFVSVMENDGLFISNNEFNLSDFKANVIVSYNKKIGHSFNEINQNSFIIYETKRNYKYQEFLIK